MADSGFNARDKYPGFNKIKTTFHNAGRAEPVSSGNTAWEVEATGAFTLADGETASFSNVGLIIPLSGLREGDKLIAYRVVGAIGSSADADAGTATLTCECIKVTRTAAGAATALIGTETVITQGGNTDDALIDQEISLSEEVVAADAQYIVRLRGTTEQELYSDITVIGVELDVKRA